MAHARRGRRQLREPGTEAENHGNGRIGLSAISDEPRLATASHEAPAQN